MAGQVDYLLMTGLSALRARAAAAANNLANVNTVGYKAQRPVMEALPLYGQGSPSRVDTAARADRPDLAPGQVKETGRPLDIAVNGPGWIAVDAGKGQTAYTRDGALVVSASGVLRTATGQAVLGANGKPIVLPALQSVSIGSDGTISGVVRGQNPNQSQTFGQILLVNPPSGDLVRRSDGLFADRVGVAGRSGIVKLRSGALEESNANAVDSMLQMIGDTKLFGMETGLARTLESAGSGTQSPMSMQ